ncbi:hypothetical protein FRACYDRAFT_262035 [Fragilariopsis cylindrus CCMP1102]|uniref:Roadblock/LAMTOR2 domain-containing protein n=1 Tax=Fragilariopsis cylindrus CCMP1102 TaxID=635003 RepID=A0A1E7F903_9STRA|nr:hypothetical protein FRACYDRAFT_262035 [Fragilariopsis cylindrus CCMP1102]|eukprot:OEU14637.1 hypothetical protein FRACYDRAFT_262035 [Fragilariopsis cylindrus CCMP1102]
MIRSCRIPSVLQRICTDNIIQTALLVTTDGELLGSTATTFISADGTSKESIESLGTLIADIAIDYMQLGNEYANLDIGGGDTAAAAAAGTSTPTSAAAAAATTSSSSSSAQQQQPPNGGSKKSTSSHLQCLFLEMEFGLVAVSACVGVDCMVIAIAAPTAPLGSVKARLHAITEYVQESFSPLTATETTSIASSYR